MADSRIGNETPENFKEAVCIDAGRVYDSCCDRDCLEDLRVYFTASAQEVISKALSVRIKTAEVLNVLIDVEPVNFNRGFYSCDLTFFFLVTLDAYTAPHSMPTTVKGISIFSKKVILFGSDGNVRVFSNMTTVEDESDPQLYRTTNMPRCVVQTVDPIPLSAKLCEFKECCDNCCHIPSNICNCIGSPIETCVPTGTPTVYITLGLFTIVQMIRNVQMLVPVYDFCIPEKHCDTNNNDQPCDIFSKIKFPTNDFFPPRPCDIEDDGFFGCCKKQD
ncbi:MAG: hypothetical protein J6V50_03785 [Clostridia bacterium]|nr:hypothetical protein [Clostridia bacterium]